MTERTKQNIILGVACFFTLLVLGGMYLAGREEMRAELEREHQQALSDQEHRLILQHADNLQWFSSQWLQRLPEETMQAELQRRRTSTQKQP